MAPIPIRPKASRARLCCDSGENIAPELRDRLYEGRGKPRPSSLASIYPIAARFLEVWELCRTKVADTLL